MPVNMLDGMMMIRGTLDLDVDRAIVDNVGQTKSVKNIAKGAIATGRTAIIARSLPEQ